MKTSIFFRITCTDETFTTQPLKLNSQFWFNVRFAYFTMWYIWFSSHYQISAFCWARILSVSFLSPFSIFSYYFSFSHNLCFTAVVADQYLLMSVYEHWASCTIAELQLIHTSVASSAQTDLTNYSWLRQGTVFCLGCLDCFWVFFLLCCDTVNRAVGHSAGFGIKEV